MKTNYVLIVIVLSLVGCTALISDHSDQLSQEQVVTPEESLAYEADVVGNIAKVEMIEIINLVYSWKDRLVRQGVSKTSLCRTISFDVVGLKSGDTSISKRIAPAGTFETKIAIWKIELDIETSIPTLYGDVYQQESSLVLVKYQVPLFTSCSDTSLQARSKIV